MSLIAARRELPRLQASGQQLVIAVSARKAEQVQTHLRRQGIRSTWCLIPYSDEATLEIWSGVDAGSVDAALKCLQSFRADANAAG